MAVKEIVEDKIANNTVAIFSKSWSKNFPDVATTIIELDEREDGPEIQAYLAKKTGQSTVPNIFVNEKHVGGNDDAQAAHKKGELRKLVAA
ncbi:glutaredoxin [Rhodocollybia butyracea]|uniref:Glutaredoxin n=1 Tax=Rhodocollybia butyracea TaxID=206335 RepID=A0A9P5Q9K3_9AGAR|nr:glutaredoxin [Rhodocollybia butyracea]